MNRVFFVSGTDTDVGKSVATGMMARFLRERGVEAATVKLVQTGCRGCSEDVETHRRLMGIPSLPEDAAGLTAPQIFAFPASPHLAAARENRSVDTAKIAEAVRQVAARYPVTLVEGAGGLAVPLTPSLLTIDFAAGEGWPTILVCSGKLGGLNHAILSLEALARRRMPFAGVVYNYCANADPVIDRDSPETIRRYLRAYGLRDVLVRLDRVDPDRPTPPDFSPIFAPEAI